LNAIFTAHPNKILQFSEQLSAWGRVQIRHFIQYFSELVHQTMLLMLLPDGTNLGNVNPICQKLASYKFTMHQLERMHLVLEQSAYHIERNANAKIQITAMLIKLASIVLNKRLTSLDVYKLETAI
jgi:DNA polymerase III gamma/tau subunit